MGKKNSKPSKKLKKEVKKVKPSSKNASKSKSYSIKDYEAAHKKCMKKNDTLKSELKEAKKKIKQLEKALQKINNKIARSKPKAVTKKAKVKKKTAKTTTTGQTVVKKEALKISPSKKVASTIKPAQDTVIKPVDNLKLIEGIGPAIEKHLRSVGINSFAVLGQTPPSKIKAILLERGGSRYSVHDPTSWSQQAKLILAGKMDELKALQQKLKAGK